MSEDGRSERGDGGERSPSRPGGGDAPTTPKGVPSDLPPIFGWKDNEPAPPGPGETPDPPKKT